MLVNIHFCKYRIYSNKRPTSNKLKAEKVNKRPASNKRPLHHTFRPLPLKLATTPKTE